jgi:7-cyano-7-deazaguanine synthase
MKTVLIFSGGLDSTSLLYKLKKEGDIIHCINFDYGSKHNDRERLAARMITANIGVPMSLIELPFINFLFKSSLLSSGEAVPHGHYADDNMKKTVVPFRNAIMLSIASGYAASIGADRVAAGIHAGDHTIYPDCRKIFFEAFKNLLEVGLWEHVDFYAPFLNLDKGEVAYEGYIAGAPLELTYSCYEGGAEHCGQCGACTERREALDTLNRRLEQCR